jgi:hypothetical protein
MIERKVCKSSEPCPVGSREEASHFAMVGLSLESLQLEALLKIRHDGKLSKFTDQEVESETIDLGLPGRDSPRTTGEEIAIQIPADGQLLRHAEVAY